MNIIIAIQAKWCKGVSWNLSSGSLVPRPRPAFHFRTTSNEKLGGAWEQGHQVVRTTPKRPSENTAPRPPPIIALQFVFNIMQTKEQKWGMCGNEAIMIPHPPSGILIVIIFVITTMQLRSISTCI